MLRQQKLSPQEQIGNSGGGARILYSAASGLAAAATVAVSGDVYLPEGTPPAGGWPVVAWAHGTTGIANICAPSWHGRARRDSVYLRAWLAHGFAIVATDYPGLGTAGPHPYLLYRPEGLAILDSVRAALSVPAFHLANEVVLVGQSQGAGAALGAAWLAPRAAPGLHVKAAVLTGLVATIATRRADAAPAKPASYTDPARMDPSFAMLRFAGTDRALHPDMDPQSYLTAQGKMLYHVAQTGCLHDLFNAAAAAGIKTGGALFSRGIAPVDSDMESHFDLPDGHVAMPVFVGTGLSDSMAGTGGQYSAVRAMCAAGTPLIWRTYPGATHSGAVNLSLRDSLPFVLQALTGRPQPSNCHAITPPGALQPPAQGIAFND
jgi:acetyl esterase/lipase